ncbi:hypothetical protein [Paenibacillus paridis]|uniref:hypothetical protein n=1 Tax=Paenibacillus paridis TaxID=2583376 RepID=UPI0013914E7F|nr:hypothetical protein [Paenibacillus paridis]
MGLLYEMVLKKRKSAFLLQQQGNGKQSIEGNIRQKLTINVELTRYGSNEIRQQS